MALDPNVVAAYEAVMGMIGDRPVRVEDPRLRMPVPTDVLGMIATSAPAYSVQAIPLHYGINCIRNERFGFPAEYKLVENPVPQTDPTFAARLADLVLPVLDRMLAAAAEQRAVETADLAPGESVEAWDQIKRIG
ncbi:hypothetical protein [Alloactinosynnema sp. L-07]|uniref:hypothetical protein n=1 Tax=Alloactinosynnema sp. L-07 TaxID=1653480 RepID=UPI00065F07A2|nr:hypothetical protein [Alloactinosynnema sp. L-07]CRK59022.1 hypothetical protein [Alloactinosynnema sp. L-07]